VLPTSIIGCKIYAALAWLKILFNPFNSSCGGTFAVLAFGVLVLGAVAVVSLLNFNDDNGFIPVIPLNPSTCC